MNRGEGADPSKDVGPWKHVESVRPYETWEKRLPGGGRAQVRMGDASPDSDVEYWAHIEHQQDGEWEWSPDVLPSGNSYERVLSHTMDWIEHHKRWTPGEDAGGFVFGSSFSGANFGI